MNEPSKELSWEQREAAFAVTLGRSGAIWASESRHEGSVVPPTPVRELADLAKNVAGLCSQWEEAAIQAHHGALSDEHVTQVVDSALRTCAKCLSILSSLHVKHPLDEVRRMSTGWSGVGPLIAGEDLGLSAMDRVGRILAYYGDVGEYYSDYVDHPESTGAAVVATDVTAMLAGKAICAALAAERGLWKAEEE